MTKSMADIINEIETTATDEYVRQYGTDPKDLGHNAYLLSHTMIGVAVVGPKNIKCRVQLDDSNNHGQVLQIFLEE